MLVTKPTVFFVTDISIIIELLGGLFGIFCFFCLYLFQLMLLSLDILDLSAFLIDSVLKDFWVDQKCLSYNSYKW